MATFGSSLLVVLFLAFSSVQLGTARDDYLKAFYPQLRLRALDSRDEVDGRIVKNIQLSVAGQGVVMANWSRTQIQTEDSHNCVLRNDDKATMFTFTVSATHVKLEYTSKEEHVSLIKEESMADVSAKKPWIPSDLINIQQSDVILWISIDKKNGFLKLGFGYPILENTILSGHLEDQESELFKDIGKVTSISCSILPVEAHATKFPIVKELPAAVIHVDANTLDILARNTAITPDSLPEEGRRLYGNVAGRNVIVSDDDAKAIDKCIKKKGCFLYEKLKEKSTEFGSDPNMVYIRVTIGPDRGDSPGSPYVMEIWPPRCYSPIHDHANSVAVIKVLYGQITSRWFNPLAETDNNPNQSPIGEATFHQGEITYLTPVVWQTHQLHNKGEVTCITIQSYKYVHSDDVHYETFDYITKDDTTKQHFKPDSDYDYLELLELLAEENGVKTEL